MDMNTNTNVNFGTDNSNQNMPTNGENFSYNNSNFSQNSNNNAFSNKKKLIILILIILLVIISILLFILFNRKLFNKNDVNNNSNNNQGNTEVTKGAEVIQLSISNNYVLMLDKHGDLYLYGEYETSGIGIGPESYEKPTKIASNVKYFDDYGRIIIVNNEDTAYYIGADIDGWGTTDEFELVTSNIKKITSTNFCFFILDKDNNYIVKAPLENITAKSWCALPKELDGNFSNITNNVKDIYSNGLGANGYLTDNNDLYISDMHDIGYKKALSNVNKIVGDRIITNEGNLYYLDYDNGKWEFVKIIDNIEDVYATEFGYIYKTSDNEFFYRNNMIKLEYNDIKVPYYYNDSKFVYLNNNNKIILSGEVDKYELKVSIDSMKQIYDFVK